MDLQVRSGFACTVMGTFEVFAAAQIPALWGDFQVSRDFIRIDRKYSQYSHGQEETQQELFLLTQLKLPDNVDWDKSENEVQERPVAWKAALVSRVVVRTISREFRQGDGEILAITRFHLQILELALDIEKWQVVGAFP